MLILSVVFGVCSIFFITVVNAIMTSKEAVSSNVFMVTTSFLFSILFGALDAGVVTWEELSLSDLVLSMIVLYIPFYFLSLQIKRRFGAFFLKAFN